MTNRIILLLFLCTSFTSSQAQKLQLGFSASMNNTFFHKSASTFDESYYTTKPALRFGLAIPVYIKLNPQFTLRTGIGYQIKEYRFSQNKLDFPGLNGSVDFNARFMAAEIPLLIGYKAGGPEKKYGIEYSAGCIIALNSPTQNGMGYGISYESQDSFLIAVSSPEPSWKRIMSPDLYAGISLIRYKGQQRRHQLSLSYQFGLVRTTRYEVSTFLQNSTVTKNYHAVLKPTLSCVAITYTFFPRCLNLIRDKAVKQKS